MSKFQITSKAGQDFGVYEGATADHAFAAMIEDGGSSDGAEGAAADWTITEVESWEAWEDGKEGARVLFFVPAHGTCDVAELGANALGVDVSESLNVQRVTQ